MGCGNQQSGTSSSDAWLQECPGDSFCFSRPAALVLQPGQVIDSLVARYRSDALTLTFDMGRYATSTSHLGDATQELTTIDGRPARLLIAGREMMLIVPKVYEGGSITVQFTMTLRFAGEPSRALAQRIFQSIQFKPPR